MAFSRKEELEKCLSFLDEEEVIRFLSDLIGINSSNPPGNEKNVAERVKLKLDEYGIECNVMELEQANRANLFARIGDESRGPNLVYSGHYDVVPSGEGWKFDPFGAVVENDVMYGRGTSDMKGGDAAMTMAMCILKKAGVPLNGALSLLGTSGEEVDLYGSKAYVERFGADGIDALAISEASNGDILVAEKGALWLKFVSKGKRAHGGQPRQGVNALTNMIQFIERIQGMQFDVVDNEFLTPPTLCLTSMHAGDLTNVIPDRCEATVDIRTIPGNSHSDLLARIAKELDELKKENGTIDISTEIQHDLLPIGTDVNNSLVGSAKNAYRAIFRKEPDLKGVVYYTDAVPFREVKPELPLVIFGPGDYSRNHKIDEYVELKSVLDATRFYIAFALDYLK